MGKQMRKVWYDIEIEDPEEKRHEDKDEEVKKFEDFLYKWLFFE